MTMPLTLEIVTPERLAYEDDVDMVIVPGVEGELGILPHHAPLVTTLGLGELRIRKGTADSGQIRICASRTPVDCGPEARSDRARYFCITSALAA